MNRTRCGFRQHQIFTTHLCSQPKSMDDPGSYSTDLLQFPLRSLSAFIKVQDTVLCFVLCCSSDKLPPDTDGNQMQGRRKTVSA
ncbi:hypothetical protein GDO81_023186 [Engystomops pustulosus]|uniref:Uncharacterized protein n=1 Tax=Engystomops pustulosus TaxID=76066 RepID=A0AAV6ZSI2_ENGPU|nr:hypothetical protein GDO81_023186 [Engystomops pustulosus]